jgi:hypothetical protein
MLEKKERKKTINYNLLAAIVYCALPQRAHFRDEMVDAAGECFWRQARAGGAPPSSRFIGNK